MTTALSLEALKYFIAMHPQCSLPSHTDKNIKSPYGLKDISYKSNSHYKTLSFFKISKCLSQKTWESFSRFDLGLVNTYVAAWSWSYSITELSRTHATEIIIPHNLIKGLLRTRDNDFADIPHQRDCLSLETVLNCLFDCLWSLTSKKKSKALYYFVWGVYQWSLVSFIKDQYAENISRSWRHLWVR